MERPFSSRGGRLPEFRVHGDAGMWGEILIDAKWFNFTCSQRIRQAGAQEMFESVGLYFTQEPDGALVIRVVVFNPDWETPLQIARIESRPDSSEDLLTPLGLNLDHIAFSNPK